MAVRRMQSTRRQFLSGALTAAATVAVAPRGYAGTAGRTTGPVGEVVDEQPFGRVEKIGGGVWALVSTPLKADGSFNAAALPTLCNGGLIAGDDRVVAIEGYYRPEGAAYMAGLAKKLTGRHITDVIVSHFHADHSGGLAGFQEGANGPEIIATDTTRKLIYENYAAPVTVEGDLFASPAIRPVLPTKLILDESKPLSFDLGGRRLTLDPLSGHTPSDLAVFIDDEPIVFAGDLVWAGIFHNYVNAIPSQLRRSVAKLLRDPQVLIVTGHGHLALAGDLGPYLDLLDLVEEKARAAFALGQTEAEGAAGFHVPESLGPWALFNPGYYETAFKAWYRELVA